VRRHELDPISLVFGLAFGFMALFVLTGNSVADLSPVWAWTLPAVAIGLLLVLYGARRAWRRDEESEPTPEAEVEP
jgi:membrane protein implicated in regulation of membrane protease activity